MGETGVRPGAKGRWRQYHLSQLFALALLVAIAMSVLRSPDLGTVTFAVATLLLIWMGSTTFREKSAQRLGILVGACAGFLITAFHGTALPLEVYKGRPGLVCALSSGIVFGAAGLLVTVFATNISDRVRFTTHWLLAGLIVGPTITHIGVLIASASDSLLPITDGSRVFTANLFAVFLGATMGGVLGTDATADYELGEDATGHRLDKGEPNAGADVE